MFSPEYIKQHAAIDHNVYDHDIVVSEKWVIDSVILPIIGTCLWERLCWLPEVVKDPQTGQFIPTPNNIDLPYYELKYGLIFDCIAWGVRADVGPQLHNKIRNAGVIRSTDEQIQAVMQDDLMRNKDRYENRMRFYEERLKKFLCGHRQEFPELECANKECCPDCGCECHSKIWNIFGPDKYNEKGKQIIGGFVL